MKKWIWLLLLFAGIGAHSASIAQMVVVLNVNTPVNTLTREQVADIFLGRANVLPNKEKIIPIERIEGSLHYVDFHNSVTLKNSTQIRAHWAKMVFAGKSTPPREMSQEETKRLIETQRNYISYIEKNLVSDKLKIVFVY
jgi:ABC-type phosphate transport system substrate-binding protein